jgi:hypothetical protein
MEKFYYAAVDGYLFGAQRQKGDPIGQLTAAQAKYDELGGRITDVNPAIMTEPEPPRAEPDPATLGRKTR